MSLDRTRQADIFKVGRNDSSITIIGSGSVGSFTALAIGKMGAKVIEIFDEDGVSDVNLPNQFFRHQDLKKFKVNALADIMGEFTDTKILPQIRFYKDQPLKPVVIVATDSMSSRKMVWEQFKKQPAAQLYIEARMGAELGMVYTLAKSGGKVPDDKAKFYESRLYSDDKVPPQRCTNKAIIYNVLMLSSLISRVYKGVAMNQPTPTEVIFNMTFLDQRSLMLTA